jgi:hypothetical protein
LPARRADVAPRFNVFGYHVTDNTVVALAFLASVRAVITLLGTTRRGR